MGGQETSLGGLSKEFPDTQWGLISRVQDSSPDIRREGLETVCQRYWKPIYGYVRRAWGKSNEDAKDLTQAFFLWLTEKETLRGYSAERASFRAFLKTLLRRFAEHRERAVHRIKRGGRVKVLRLDRDDSLIKFNLEDPRGPDAEQVFERLWVNEVLTRAVERLRHRLTSEGRELQLRVFEEHDLCAGREPPSYEEVAERLGVQNYDVRNYLFVVREQLRQEIRSELEQTTGGPGELEEEWDALFGS